MVPSILDELCQLTQYFKKWKWKLKISEVWNKDGYKSYTLNQKGEKKGLSIYYGILALNQNDQPGESAND